MKDQGHLRMGWPESGRRGSKAGSGTPARKWAQVVVGLFLFAVAMALLIRSGLGLGPWDAFHVGVSTWSGVSVGVAIVVVGFVILIAGLFLGVRPGPATIANMFLIGVFLDLILPHIPEAGAWTAVPYHIGGIALWGLATGLYIAPGLGKGPRDGLMLGIAQRSGWPVGRVRTGIELAVLGAGWLLGGPVGVGTVLFALGIGPATEWGLGLFGLIPARRSRLSITLERAARASKRFRRSGRGAEPARVNSAR